MSSTALGAEKAIIFISDAHEKFYYEKLKEVRYQDVYHKALVYCLGISDDTRRNIYSIYDFKTGCVKTECLHEGWQTSGSVKVVRMPYNLYCNGTPSVLDYDDAEEQVDECRMYTVEELFCCAYAAYFWQVGQMKKREFQKKATAALFKRLVAVCAELGANPNITVSSKFHSSYFKLRNDYNLIQISVKQTGELSYQLTDMLGSTGGKRIYYEYRENDAFTLIIEKFSDDFARLYKDFLLSGTLHDFCDIRLSYGEDAGAGLEEYESCIGSGGL